MAAFLSAGRVSREVLDEVLRVAPPMLFPRGSCLCLEGEVGFSCFLILQGRIEVLKATGAGSRCMATLGPGSTLGQMALLDGAPRSASLRACEDVVAVEIGRAEFQGLLKRGQGLGHLFLKQLLVAGISQLRMADSRLAMALGGALRPQGGSPPRSVASTPGPPSPWGVPQGGPPRIAFDGSRFSERDLENIEFVTPDGMLSPQELRARRKP
jgi:hypothetical protein